MEIISQNKCSSLGMFFGAIALILGIFHFHYGPFSAPPLMLESAVAEKVSAIKNGIIAGMKDEKPPAAAKKNAINIDNLLKKGGIKLAVIALGCAFIGGMRKENSWGITGAILFGGGTLAFHALLFGFGVICSLLLLILVFYCLTNGHLL